MSFDYLNGINAGENLAGDIQGNILRAYSATNNVLCFIRFGADQAKNRGWLRAAVLDDSAPFRVTSSRDQGLPELRKKRRVNFLLTQNGYGKFGFRSSDMPSDDSFRAGSRAAVKRLNDPLVDQWQPEYKEGWDALLLVACARAELGGVQSNLEKHLAGIQHHLEFGNVLDRRGAPISSESAAERYEAFGYRDGLSQFYFDEGHAAEDGIPLQPVFNPRRPLSLVLTPDPLVGGSYGSLFVFRKLKQDVKLFRDHVSKVANELNGGRGRFLHDLYKFKDGRMGRGKDAFGKFDPKRQKKPSLDDVKELVKEAIMGRNSEGVVSYETVDGSAPHFRPNHEIDFAGDRAGTQCPFHAHIRKLQPRGGTGDPEDEAERGIVRRGLPYGRADRDGECGLLFLCAQSSIARQFEFLQSKWSNGGSSDYSKEPTPAVDNVGGQPKDISDALTEELGVDRLRRYLKTIDADFRAYPFIELRAAEYLFAPSIVGLRRLAGGGAS